MKTYKIMFSAEVDIEAENSEDAQSAFINLSGKFTAYGDETRTTYTIDNTEIMETEEVK